MSFLNPSRDNSYHEANDDELVSPGQVEKRDAESEIDRAVHNLSPIRDSTPGIRLMGKHLASKHPQQLTIANFQNLYFRDPVGFIGILYEVHPLFKSTVDLAATMATNGNFRFEVRDKGGMLVHEKGEELTKFFENQPLSVGNINTLVGTLYKELTCFADGCAFQAIGVPGDETGEMGYSYIKPFSTNTTNLGQSASGEQKLFQHSLSGKLIELSAEHTYWQPYEPTLSSPNGTYAMSSGIMEALSEMISARDFRDGVRAAGNPIRLFHYDRDSMIKTAVETMGITIRAGAKIANFIAEQIKAIENYAKNRKNAEALVLAKDVVASNLQPSDFRMVIPAMESLLNRSSVSWNTFPNLLGHGDSTKQSLQYQLVAQRVSYNRDKVLRLIERVSEKHFLLMGSEVQVTLVAPKIHLTDELVAENTAQMHLLNTVFKYALGLISREELAHDVTGSSPTGPEIEGAIEAILKISTTPGGNDKNASSQADKTGGKSGRPPSK